MSKRSLAIATTFHEESIQSKSLNWQIEPGKNKVFSPPQFLNLGSVFAKGVVGRCFTELNRVISIALAVGDFCGVPTGSGGLNEIFGLCLGAGEDG